ncbi:carbohydrate ABC transporter permease [Nonomuraea sp. CA-143628]|uniref:carbohydrate ABC transporter permease n=1 Tax=Nonomuraea sp. CA-143628 TaxID=3239997 RepID=UPI003D8A8545
MTMLRSVARTGWSALRYIAVTVMVIMAGFPLYWMLNTALASDDDLYGSGQKFLLQLQNFPNLLEKLGEVELGTWVSNSVLIAFGTTLLALTLGSLAGYALSRFRFRGKGFTGFLMFSTQVLPEALILVPLYTVFIKLGLLNNLGGLVLADTAFVLPVTAFVLKGAMDKIPYELEESAMIDKCPRLSILTMIVLPIIAPSVAAAAVVAFFAGWNEYLFAATFVSDRELWPASVGLASFIGQNETPMSAIMGSALVFAIPAITFFLLVQRRIIAGIASGAVKG